MLRDIAAGALLGMVVLGLPLACSGGRLSPVVRCQLEALKILPEDPHMVTVFDGVDLVERIQACKRAGDAAP